MSAYSQLMGMYPPGTGPNVTDDLNTFNFSYGIPPWPNVDPMN
jgi:hypothetical protein